MKAGWKPSRLGEVVEAVLTGPFGSILHKSDYAEDGIPLVNPANIIGDQISLDGIKLVGFRKAKELKSYELQTGDIVIGRRGEIGRCAVVSSQQAGWLCGTGSFIVRPGKAFDPRFLAAMLRSPACIAELVKAASGATMPNLSNGSLSDLCVFVPPLDEQRRIVAVLDKAFAGIATATANAQKNLTNARALFESFAEGVFAELTCLTATRPQLETLTEAKSGITYGVVKPGDVGSIPFVRGGDLIGGEVRLDRLRTITDEVSTQYRRTLLKGGELLMCLVGVPGQCAIAPPELAGANIARQVGLVRLRQDVNANFVKDYLQSPLGQKALGTFTGGSVQQVINLGDLRQVEIPLPDRSMQDEMVNRIALAKKFADQLARTSKSKLAALTELKQSLLHKAFAGELT